MKEKKNITKFKSLIDNAGEKIINDIEDYIFKETARELDKKLAKNNHKMDELQKFHIKQMIDGLYDTNYDNEHETKWNSQYLEDVDDESSNEIKYKC